MFGIILGLVLLMVLAFKGWSILWAAPIAATVVALTGGLDLLQAYTITYMQGFVGFTASWFPVFMLGAIFGKLMEVSGMAKSVAVALSNKLGKDNAIIAIVVACGILTFGGVSLFVVVFAIYPLAISLFREANIPRRLIPAAIALGSFTFTMTAIPGTPAIQNLIPMDHFGTGPLAAPIMGIASALIMGIGGCLYLRLMQKRYMANGEAFDEPDNFKEEAEKALPNPWLSIIPLITVLVLINVFNIPVVPSLLIANVVILLLDIKSYKTFIPSINAGANGSMTAILNTSAAVGFGAVVAAVPAFNDLADALFNIPGGPLASLAVAVNLLAGVTGSASGGLGIALQALGPYYMELAYNTGINPEAMHRVASLSSGGLDVLPHNGAVLTLLAITGLTHKDSYKDIAVVGILIPLAGLVVAIMLGSIGLY